MLFHLFFNALMYTYWIF